MRSTPEWVKPFICLVVLEVEIRISRGLVAPVIAEVLTIVRIGTDVDGLLYFGFHLNSFVELFIKVKESKVAHLFISHIRVA